MGNDGFWHLDPGDELLVSDHEYAAIVVAELPLILSSSAQVIEAIRLLSTKPPERKARAAHNLQSGYYRQMSLSKVREERSQRPR